MQRSRLFARRGALAAAVLLSLAAVAHAQERPAFVPLDDLAGKRPSGRTLFFPLPDGFEAASPYALVPAKGRRIAWMPEGTQLTESALPVPAMRAVGSPPPQPETARYLVPVLDGAGLALEVVPRRLDDGRLVPYEGTPRPGLDAVPLLAGPRLDATPSREAPDRVLGAPVEVDAAELVDVVPSLLVRKAPPSRVVFGVRLGPDLYIPLVAEDGLAVAARHGGRRGLAAPLPGGVDVATVPDDEPADEPTPWTDIAAVVAAASVVVGGLGLLAWRRGGRHRA